MQRCTIIALIVGICHVNGALSKVRTMSKNYTDVPSMHFFMETKQLVSTSQIYGTCLKRDSENAGYCQFSLETNHPMDSPDHVRTCYFDVKFPDESGRINDIAPNGVAAIAKDKALLILSNLFVHNLYVLHFSDCKAIPIEYRNDTSIRVGTPVLYATSPRDDLVDVLFHGFEDKTLHRLTVNAQGKVVADVPEWLPFTDLETYDRTFLYSSSKGRLTALFEDESREQNKTVIKIVAVDDNGMNHTINEHKFPKAATRVVSVTNKLLTACASASSEKLTCVQYDENGDLKFETQLPHELKAEVYNLAGGGFNLVPELCSETNYMKRCPQEKREFAVTKVDRTGKVYGTLRIPEFNCFHAAHVHFFEAENGEQCFSTICHLGTFNRETSFRHDTTCFSNEDYVTSTSSPIK